ncbi:MAG: ATP-binding protein [Gemmataceae bacterium]
MPTQSVDHLVQENEELRRRLEEAEDTIRAIQGGEVDAVVVSQSEQEQVYTLDSADRPYRLLVEQMPQGAATLTVDGNILYCNRHFASLLAKNFPSMLGTRIQAHTAPESLPLLEALLRDAQSQATSGEVMLRRSDGAVVPVYLGVNALHEGVTGLCLMVTDLTEQKRQEALIAAEALARSILEQAVDAIVVCDQSGKIIRASQAANEMAGQNTMLRLFGAAFPEINLDAVLSGETLRGVETSLKRPDGRSIGVLLSAGPLRDGRKQVVGCVVNLTDITERKRAEQALKDADRRKDEFLATLAHELRNPLAPIKNSLQVIRMKAGDAAARDRMLEITERQVNHLVRLVDDLLDVARVTSDKIELRKQRVELAAVVQSAVETSRPIIEKSRHTLEVMLPPEPITLDADPVRFSQILSNLLHNAAKYTDPGGRIDLIAGREKGQVVLRIKDTGVGISAEMLPRVFDMFTQIDRYKGRSQGGLGVGLSLVRSLVRLHGGTIEAHSAGPGCGSEFVVRLPAG